MFKKKNCTQINNQHKEEEKKNLKGKFDGKLKLSYVRLRLWIENI